MAVCEHHCGHALLMCERRDERGSGPPMLAKICIGGSGGPRILMWGLGGTGGPSVSYSS